MPKRQHAGGKLILFPESCRTHHQPFFIKRQYGIKHRLRFTVQDGARLRLPASQQPPKRRIFRKRRLLILKRLLPVYLPYVVMPLHEINIAVEYPAPLPQKVIPVHAFSLKKMP